MKYDEIVFAIDVCTLKGLLFVHIVYCNSSSTLPHIISFSHHYHEVKQGYNLECLLLFTECGKWKM